MRRFGLNKQARRPDFFDSTILVTKRGKVVESFLDAGLIFIFRRRFEKVLGYDMGLMIRQHVCGVKKEQRNYSYKDCQLLCQTQVVVQLECAANLQVEKDSSLPLGMTTN
jgi:hypothetical protein